MISDRDLIFFLIDELLLAWDECAELLDEVRALDRENQLEKSRRTLGGTPPAALPWKNVAIAPPVPAPGAPPLRSA